MNKSNCFFGQSVFGQLISLIDLSKINTIARKHKADYYVKKFDISDHLISMLFSTFAHCTSLREVAASMLGLKGKMNHFQLEKGKIAVFNYIHLMKFLENPEKEWIKEYDVQIQFKFSSS